MGDYGKVDVSAGYTRFDARDFGKVGVGYSYQNEFSNPNIGYKLAGNASALIGNGHGVNSEVYAGLDFGKMNCTQFNIGLMADYTQAFEKDKVQVNTTITNGNIEGVLANVDINSNRSLKTGLEVGFTRNLCCDDDKKLKLALNGGAEFHSNPKLNANGTEIQYSNKMNKVSPFLGAKAEYSKKVNSKGNEFFINGKCYISENVSTYGEAGIGFRF